jgi:hypothetical protein
VGGVEAFGVPWRMEEDGTVSSGLGDDLSRIFEPQADYRSLLRRRKPKTDTPAPNSKPMLPFQDFPPHLTLSGAPTSFAEVPQPSNSRHSTRSTTAKPCQEPNAPLAPRGPFVHPSRQALVDGTAHEGGEGDSTLMRK